MQKDGYINVSAKLESNELGLGWLTGVTVWRTSKAVSMASHRHPHIELLFCLKGNLIYEIEEYGSVTVSEGTGIMIPSDTQHIMRDGTTANPSAALHTHGHNGHGGQTTVVIECICAICYTHRPLNHDIGTAMTILKKIHRLIPVPACALMMLSGCMWGRVKVNDPAIADLAQSVKPGVTRVSELDDILKARPSFRMPSGDMTLLGYTYSDTKTHGLMLIAVNFMRSTTATDTLYIEADSKTHVVQKVHIPPKRTHEWRFWPFGD